MTVLAIDLGRNMGWVLGKSVGPIEHGLIQLEDTTDLGRFVGSMVEPLRPLLRRSTAVAVEKPDTAGLSYFGIRKNMAALGMLHYLCFLQGLAPPNEISVTTGKLTLAGHGRADKDAMIFAAIEKGLPMGISEHEADAYGIWWVHMYGPAERNKPKTRSGKGRSILKGDPE